MPYTVSHVTHEALQKVGGIGTVLQGLMTSRAYQKSVRRSILVGPLNSLEDEEILQEEGEVLYSSISGLATGRVASDLERIVRKYDVNLIYGRRKMRDSANGVTAEPEVLLIDSTSMNSRLETNFKFNLYKRFGLESDLFEDIEDYLLYLKIAEPGFEALEALLNRSQGPHFILAHEYMGMPLALKAILAENPKFRTIFYAHEVSTMRDLVENSDGHDTMFYNVLDKAILDGLGVSDVFGDRSTFYRHALILRSQYCDAIFAVGDYTEKELRFLDPVFQDLKIDLVYNGIPAFEISLKEKQSSSNLLQAYCESLLGYTPNVIFTHVTRPVISKGLWRDLRVLEHLEGVFAKNGSRGVLYVLSSADGQRSEDDVTEMEEEYGWPVQHKSGAPDLVGPEEEIWRAIQDFNARAKAIQIVFVNQFGWDRASCGTRMPDQMNFLDLRKGSDVEFGLSVYEPFGIASVEPLSFGALCAVSNVSGCCGYVQRASDGEEPKNFIVGDYTSLNENGMSLAELKEIGIVERNQLESLRSAKVAQDILSHLPQTDGERGELIQSGFELANQMSWERVCTDLFLPGLARAANGETKR